MLLNTKGVFREIKQKQKEISSGELLQPLMRYRRSINNLLRFNYHLLLYPT